MKQPQLPTLTASPRGIGAIAASLEAESSTLIPENIPLGSGLYDDVELRDMGAAQSQKVRCCLTIHAMLDLPALPGARAQMGEDQKSSHSAFCPGCGNVVMRATGQAKVGNIA